MLVRVRGREEGGREKYLVWERGRRKNKRSQSGLSHLAIQCGVLQQDGERGAHRQTEPEECDEVGCQPERHAGYQPVEDKAEEVVLRDGAAMATIFVLAQPAQLGWTEHRVAQVQHGRPLQDTTPTSIQITPTSLGHTWQQWQTLKYRPFNRRVYNAQVKECNSQSITLSLSLYIVLGNDCSLYSVASALAHSRQKLTSLDHVVPIRTRQSR